MRYKCSLIIVIVGQILLLISNVSCYPSLDGRIIGGENTDISTVPYTLSLQYNENHICGASILNAKNGITAAHCIVGKPPSSMSLYAGSNFYNIGGFRIKISSIISHKNYDNETSNFDIAIIKFAGDLKFNNKILPVALPDQDYAVPTGTLAIVSGWGYVQEITKYVSYSLRKVEVPVVERSKCRQLYRGKGDITNRMLCAGAPQGGRDACQGDSGGPLTVNGKLIGVVSWGYGCARPGYPGVYTRVAKFRNWIKRFADV